MSWLNSDGLYIKYGTEESAVARGGEVINESLDSVIEFTIDYKDLLSATPTLLGQASGTEQGSVGIVIPAGLFIREVETIAVTAFTSSGTIGSSTLQIGLVRATDRSTVMSNTALTTASFVGSSIDAAGEDTVLRVGSTGAGAYIGTTIANDGLVVVANTAHATHPYTAGKLRVRVRGFYPAQN